MCGFVALPVLISPPEFSGMATTAATGLGQGGKGGLAKHYWRDAAELVRVGMPAGSASIMRADRDIGGARGAITQGEG